MTTTTTPATKVDQLDPTKTGIVGVSAPAPAAAPDPTPGTAATSTSAPPMPSAPATTDATATQWKVNDKQTVAGQIKGIVGADSPLMQQAATAAKQQANARGLLNSSMAVGAGQDALYRAALPIAQQDASTYGAAAKYNADAANSMSTFNAGARNQASFQAFDAAFKTAYQAADLAGQKQLETLRGDIQKSLAEVEAKYKTQMQTSASMADTYNGLVQSITNIMGNPDMDAAAKQAAINNVTQLYNSALQSQKAITGLDLGELLAFSPPPSPAPSPAPAPAPGPSPAPAPAPNPYPFPESTGP